ncbi:hypothetical protein [Bacillus atrophaeus]|uniref:hypothetical protein n=1 Tax=Bacillus atrophaeus TaxID=1452 RepID=UPI002E24CF1D|nr:hypothetical protein [Bacillus atrophaeus]MED4843935.1 hypothetical protein [Bacillus atrophaeus]
MPENNKLDMILNAISEFRSDFDTFKEDTQSQFTSLNQKIDQLSEKIGVQHTENINADNLLLNEINSLKEGVFFVNRKVADAELELHTLKNRKQ